MLLTFENQIVYYFIYRNNFILMLLIFLFKADTVTNKDILKQRNMCACRRHAFREEFKMSFADVFKT